MGTITGKIEKTKFNVIEENSLRNPCIPGWVNKKSNLALKETGDA